MVIDHASQAARAEKSQSAINLDCRRPSAVRGVCDRGRLHFRSSAPVHGAETRYAVLDASIRPATEGVQLTPYDRQGIGLGRKA